jgi:elongation factor G
MRVFSTSSIRNIALIGHSHSGKTSLASALLFAAGATPRLGKTDDGTTVTDFDDIAVAHKLSIQTGLARAEWRDHKINILDTPGSNAFILDARAGLRASDAALVVVDAHNGVEVGTEKVWNYALELNVPCAVFVNKLDKDQADFDACLASLQENLDTQVVAFHLPVGSEKTFRGLADVISQRAFLYHPDGSGKFSETDIPADVQDAVTAAREALIEKVAETDDALLEKFFADGTLSDDDLIAGIRSAFTHRTLTPVFVGSATAAIGAAQLLDALVQFAPDPAHATGWVGASPNDPEAVVTRHIDGGEPFSAFVFKTLIDQFNRITLCKIISGTLKSEATVLNANRGTLEKLGPLHALQGKQLDKITEAGAGDIIALTKLKDTLTGDTLCDKAAPVRFYPTTMPAPAISFAIEPKSRADEDKLSVALSKLLEQDQSLRYTRDSQTKEFLLAGSGQQHVEITVERLKKRYGVDVELHQPKVAYLETFKGRVEVQGRHKKQTGGRGQFGDCKCVFEPLAHGAGFKFIDKIFGGSVPQNFRPAIEKGVLEAAALGALAGYPMVDFQVELIDGSYHTVDSDELSFKLAGRKAFRAAMEKVKLVLLEPIMHVEIVVPIECAGDVMGDLNTRRGRIEGIEAKGASQVIKARAPLAEMLNYAPRLNSMTSARGGYTMEYSHYDEVPAQITQKIVAEAQAAGRLHVAEEV